jgi:hypothetical protein
MMNGFFLEREKVVLVVSRIFFMSTCAGILDGKIEYLWKKKIGKNNDFFKDIQWFLKSFPRRVLDVPSKM